MVRLVVIVEKLCLYMSKDYSHNSFKGHNFFKGIFQGYLRAAPTYCFYRESDKHPWLVGSLVIQG